MHDFELFSSIERDSLSTPNSLGSKLEVSVSHGVQKCIKPTEKFRQRSTKVSINFNSTANITAIYFGISMRTNLKIANRSKMTEISQSLFGLGLRNEKVIRTCELKNGRTY